MLPTTIQIVAKYVSWRPIPLYNCC